MNDIYRLVIEFPSGSTLTETVDFYQRHLYYHGLIVNMNYDILIIILL